MTIYMFTQKNIQHSNKLSLSTGILIDSDFLTVEPRKKNQQNDHCVIELLSLKSRIFFSITINFGFLGKLQFKVKFNEKNASLLHLIY